jgi:hypothetical protein
MMDQFTEIKRALKRLEQSTTPLKRRNALRVFVGAIANLQEAVREAYPKLRRDGTAIMPKKSKGRRCPFCLVPMKSIHILRNHLVIKHNIRQGKCFCGKEFVSEKAVVRHLAKVGDLRVHLGMSELKKSAGIIK